MTSALRALWLLFIPTPSTSPEANRTWWKLPSGVWKFLIFSLVLALFGSFILSGLGRAYEASSNPGQAEVGQLHTWGPARYHLRPQIREMELNTRFRQLSQSTSVPPPPPVVLIGPEQMTQTMRQIMRHGDLNEVGLPCRGCVILEWFPSRGWHAQYVPDPNADTPTDGEQEVLLIIDLVRRGVMSSENTAPPAVKIDPSQSRQAVFGAVSSSLVGLSHFILLALAWMMIMSMGLRGYQWDMHRSTGRLEPWVVVQHPAWVIYLSQLARQACACFFLFGVFLLLCHIHSIPLVWPWAFSAWAVLPFACMVVGIWGMLATVLFHHPKGRMFARLLLSPVIVGMFWALRLMAVYMALRLQSPFLAWQNLDDIINAWPYLLLSIPFLLATSFLLLGIVQWRIGPRRQGLRRTV